MGRLVSNPIFIQFWCMMRMGASKQLISSFQAIWSYFGCPIILKPFCISRKFLKHLWDSPCPTYKIGARLF